MRLPWGAKPPRVYVDAKILNMHDPSLKREAYVGYVVEGTGESNVRMENAEETDDAEVLAVLFAIEELKDRFGRLTIVCDHESVVSEANKEEEIKNPSELMRRLRRTLDATPSIRLEVLKTNPAHKVVTEYVNRIKSPTAQPP